MHGILARIGQNHVLQECDAANQNAQLRCRFTWQDGCHLEHDPCHRRCNYVRRRCHHHQRCFDDDQLCFCRQHVSSLYFGAASFTFLLRGRDTTSSSGSSM